MPSAAREFAARKITAHHFIDSRITGSKDAANTKKPPKTLLQPRLPAPRPGPRLDRGLASRQIREYTKSVFCHPCSGPAASITLCRGSPAGCGCAALPAAGRWAFGIMTTVTTWLAEGTWDEAYLRGIHRGRRRAGSRHAGQYF